MRRACDNPFAVHRVLQQRYRLTATEWLLLMARLEQLDWRGEIVGPCGSRRPTLLDDLAARLGARGWRVNLVRLNTDERRLGPLPRLEHADIILCDGCEQLTVFAWHRLV